MGKIMLPPVGAEIKDKCLTKICIASGVKDFLEFGFADPGILAPFVSGDFTPDIPSGSFAVGASTGQLIPAVANGVVYLAYFDQSTSTIYPIEIDIKPTCP